jgi:hypothetical protein
MAYVTSMIIGGATIANTAYQGSKNRSAARAASRAQSAAAKEAQAMEAEQLSVLRGDLMPFKEQGVGAINQLGAYTSNPGADLNYLQDNPLFQASLNTADRAAVGAAANQGRIGTGGFSQQLQENYIMSALPLLQRRDQNLTNLATMGQNAAAQTGTAGLQTAQSMGSLELQGANAQSAGIAAQRQASQEMAGGLIQGAAALAPLIGSIGGPSGSRPSGYTGREYESWLSNQG